MLDRDVHVTKLVTTFQFQAILSSGLAKYTRTVQHVAYG